MRDLSPRRRRATVLAGSCCAIASSSFMLTSHNGGPTARMYGLAGILTGMLVGGAVVLWRKKQGVC